MSSPLQWLNPVQALLRLELTKSAASEGNLFQKGVSSSSRTFRSSTCLPRIRRPSALGTAGCPRGSRLLWSPNSRPGKRALVPRLEAGRHHSSTWSCRGLNTRPGCHSNTRCPDSRQFYWGKRSGESCSSTPASRPIMSRALLQLLVARRTFGPCLRRSEERPGASSSCLWAECPQR